MRTTASIVAGHTPIGFVGLTAAGQFAREGKLRLLAVMSRKPSSALPDVPTIVAAGYPGLEGMAGSERSFQLVRRRKSLTSSMGRSSGSSARRN